MLGATQAVLLGAAVCPLAGYAATVTGIAGLRAYWRLGEGSGTWMGDTTVGARHGTYTLPVGFGAPGLPQDSDSAVSFNATGYATVAHDAGLVLATFSVSLWFSLPDGLQGHQAILFSKDSTGLVNGDFVIAVEEEGELYAHFQDTSVAHRVSSDIAIAPNTTYHVVVTADETGFALWHDGRHMGRSTAFTEAWTNNTRNIQIAKVGWQVALTDAVIDEVALWSRELNDFEIILLSQRAAPPAAGASDVVLDENTTVQIDVAGLAGSSWVGRKDDLVIEVQDGASWSSSATTAHGAATVNANNDIEFAAAAVSGDQSDSFAYRITDLNGVGNAAVIGVTVNDFATGSGDGLGGTLIYEWVPGAALTDNTGPTDPLPLSQRGNSVITDVDTWIDYATVGGAVVKATSGGGGNECCFNRAPTGEPALELHTLNGTGGGSSIINLGVRLWDEMATNPRHVRVVMEVKTCSPSDANTYKPFGKGTTSGNYPVWADSFGPDVTAGKFIAGIGCGQGHTGGGGRTNWWSAYERKATGPNAPYAYDAGIRSDLDNVNNFGVRCQFNSSGRLKDYFYCYDRPGRFGTGIAASPDTRLTDTGIAGVWWKLEIELQLTTPDSIAANSTLSLTDPPTTPSNTGDGYVKIYATKDIDGQLGTPGTRQQLLYDFGWITGCKFDDVNDLDNMHILMNITRIWINLIYGGGTGSQAEAWAWIRKIQAYHYTADDI